MLMERTGIFKIAGKEATIVGDNSRVDQVAPDFKAHALDWTLVQGLADTAGIVRIIAAVPALDTDTCDRETRRFNQEASGLRKDIVIEVISIDLPYAQKHWYGTTGVDQLIVLSDHMKAEFGEKYGCRIKKHRILRQAVFVVDRQDKVVYSAYMPVLGWSRIMMKYWQPRVRH